MLVPSHSIEGVASSCLAVSVIEDRHAPLLHTPVEIWFKIIAYLPRLGLKPLLYVPHLRHIASELYFQDIDLHFGVFPLIIGRYFRVFSQYDFVQSDLHSWHLQRALDIMTRILDDNLFASRVKKIRVYACDFRDGPRYDVETGKC